jgi:hypothetical protein
MLLSIVAPTRLAETPEMRFKDRGAHAQGRFRIPYSMAGSPLVIRYPAVFS